MPLDMTSPQKLAFLAETYEKTSRLNQLWFQKNLGKINECAKLDNPKNYTVIDVQKKAMAMDIPQLTTSHKTSEVNRKKLPISDIAQINTRMKKSSLHPSVDGEEPIFELLPPLMKPVPSEDLEMLKEYKGRQRYLHKRNKMEPEDRFNEQVLEGWSHGWGFTSSYFGRPAPKFGRRSFLLNGAMSRTGAQADPHYYVQLYAITANKCANPL